MGMIGQAVETVIVVRRTQSHRVCRSIAQASAAATRKSPELRSGRVIGKAVIGYLMNRAANASTHEWTDSGKPRESNLGAVGINSLPQMIIPSRLGEQTAHIYEVLF
jgi:hypothetical protein